MLREDSLAAEVRTARESLPARYAGRTVLAIGAHPDDLEIGIGGTLARLSRSGAHVVMAVVSIPSNYETRVQEAKRGAKILGADLRVLLNGGRCCRVEDLKTYELVTLFDELVQELSPAAVLTHGSADFHRDHVLVHNAVLATQRLRFFDLFCYYPTNCRPVQTAFQPRLYVNVSQTIDTKIEAIAAHSSQFSCRGLDVEMYREIARAQGRMIGSGYAEGLDVVRMLLD
ncbi:MAG TPA: PIG-L family deacetylase [Burkholderiales bacterium]|jgi:LmbE family N-acetylglucosaminyl deacetylase|nr:PIG-L family deacetylase [Burkholderiales bacterium]